MLYAGGGSDAYFARTQTYAEIDIEKCVPSVVLSMWAEIGGTILHFRLLRFLMSLPENAGIVVLRRGSECRQGREQRRNDALHMYNKPVEISEHPTSNGLLERKTNPVLRWYVVYFQVGKNSHRMTDSTIAPSQTNDFERFIISWLLDTRKDTTGKKSIGIISCVQRSHDRRRRGVEGHRFSGDTTGSWF